MNYTELASPEVIQKVMTTLQVKGLHAELVDTIEAAKDRVLALIPEGSEVETMTSITLEAGGITEFLNESGKYRSVKNELKSMNRKTDHLQMQKLGAAPEYAIGSVHAVTESGQVLIASMTGSQLPAYAYGASHVIWVVGAQKIVTNMDEGLARINDYVLPLESERARKAYGLPESFNSQVSKLLIINNEVAPERIHIIFVNQKLGY